MRRHLDVLREGGGVLGELRLFGLVLQMVRVSNEKEQRTEEGWTHDHTLVCLCRERREASRIVQRHVEHLQLSMSEWNLLSELSEGRPVRTKGRKA